MLRVYGERSSRWQFDELPIGLRRSRADDLELARRVLNDGTNPQPVQKMTYEELMLFVVKQQKLTRNVVTCDDAGAFHFHIK